MRKYSTGIFTLTITGEEGVIDRVQTLQTRTNAAIKRAIEARTEALYKDVYKLASGTNPVRGLVRKGSGRRKNSAGSGVEMMDPSIKTGAITVRSGRLRAGIQRATGVEDGKIMGVVGWGQDYTSSHPSRLLRQRINFPKKQLNPGVVISPAGFRRKFRAPSVVRGKFGGDPPQVYVPKVILGSEIMLGRNILRMALVNDILGEVTKKRIFTELRNSFGTSRDK